MFVSALAVAACFSTGTAAGANRQDMTPPETLEAVEQCWRSSRLGERTACVEVALDAALRLDMAPRSAESVDGNHQVALKILEGALARISVNQNPQWWALVQMNVAVIRTKLRSNRGDAFEIALNELRQSAAIMDGVAAQGDFDEEDRRLVSQINQNLGRVLLHRRQGRRAVDLNEAIRHLKRAVVPERAPPELLAIRILLADAVTAHPNASREEIEWAIGEYRDVLSQQGATCNLECAFVRLSLAKTYLRRTFGDPFHNRMLGIAELDVIEALPRGSLELAVSAAIARSELLRDIDVKAAMAAATAALNTARDYPWMSESQAEAGLALSEALLGDPAATPSEVLARLKEAGEAAKHANAPRLVSGAEVALTRMLAGSSTKAQVEHSLRRALAQADEDGDVLRGAWLRVRLATVLAGPKADVAEISALVTRAWNSIEDADLSDDRLRILVALGNFHFDQDDCDGARRYFGRAMRQLLTTADPRYSFTLAGVQLRNAYAAQVGEQLAYCEMHAGNYRAAAMALQMSYAKLATLLRGASFLGPRDDTGRCPSCEGAREIRRLEGALHKNRHDAAAAVAIGEQLQAQWTALNEVVPLIALSVGGSTPDDLGAQLARAVPKGGALVMPFASTQGGGVLIVFSAPGSANPNAIRIGALTLPDLDVDAIDALGLRWGAAFAKFRRTRDSAEWREVLPGLMSDVSVRIAAPIREALERSGIPKGAPVVVIPGLGMSWLPMHAAEAAGLAALLDDFDISYASAAASLAIDASRDASTAFLPPAAILNAGSDSAAMVPVLRDLLGERVRVEPGPQRALDEDRFLELLRGREYVHIAAHGVHDARQPLDSGLELFGPDGRREGFVTASDVLGRADLTAARLVVLAACESGLSEVSAGRNEITGLAGAFVYAGARAVVSTLWPVDEAATSVLMEKFYRGMFRDRMEPSAALRAAQRWLREAPLEQLRATPSGARAQIAPCADGTSTCRPFANPYYWAAFELHGR